MTDPTAPAPDPADVYEALFRIQSDPPILKKDRDGQVGNQRTKYADLNQANEVILPILCSLDLLWISAPTLRLIKGPNGQEDPRFVLDWELRHVPSGTKLDGSYPLPAGANPMQNGSAITYARRYALVALTNAVAEDDDDDGRGYAGRGMAQRATVRQEQTRPTAQRAEGPPPRGERAQPAQRPDLPPARTQRPAAGNPPPEVAAAAEPVRGRGGLITEPMTRKLAITMKQALGDDPSVRKQFIVDMIGRDVASSKELTFEEGRHLIDAFEKANQDPDTAAVTVIDIYQRTTREVQAGGPAQGEPAPARRRAGKPVIPETRTVAEQTRDSVTGKPSDSDDDTPPWEPQPGEVRL